jgi:hypothetical protein
MYCNPGESRAAWKHALYTGAAWLSSARVVRCWVKSRNERNPYDLLPPVHSEHSNQTAQINWEEGGDDVKSVWPLRPGLHTYYNVQYKLNRDREVEEIIKTGLSSDCRLQLACMKSESLVMVHQQRYREYVPGSCTHRPSHHGSWRCPKYVDLTVAS